MSRPAIPQHRDGAKVGEPSIVVAAGKPRIAVIIPVLNEEASIAKVLDAIPESLQCRVVVADNGSTDGTAAVASRHGATVVHEPERGYGAACLAALRQLKLWSEQGDAFDIVVFLDGDYSDYPEEMPLLIEPLLSNTADLVIGSRVLGEREPGALQPHQAFGNYLAGRLIGLLYGQPTTDLGPFRAIRYATLTALRMEDRNFGWTAEMQVKAARDGMRVVEVPVRYRKRIGRSKVSGTLVGSCRAGWTILRTVFRYARSPRCRPA